MHKASQIKIKEKNLIINNRVTKLPLILSTKKSLNSKNHLKINNQEMIKLYKMEKL